MLIITREGLPVKRDPGPFYSNPCRMDFRFALSRGTPSGAQTPLPQFNRLWETFQELQAGNAMPEDVEGGLRELDDILGQMLHFFHFELQMEPDDDELAAQVPIAYDAFHRLRGVLEHLWAAQQQGHWLLFEDALGDARRWLDRLYSAMDRLRARQDAEPGTLAAIVGEVVRTGRAVLDGRLDARAFLIRVDGLETMHLELRDQLPLWQAVGREGAVLEDLRPRMMDALERELAALEACRRSVRDGDRDALFTALEQVDRAGSELVAGHEALRSAADREPTRPCFRCGGESPASSRFCVKCNAQLPPMQPVEEASQIDLRLEDGGVQAGDGQMPENLRRLMDAVDLARTGDLGALGEATASMASRLDEARRRFAALPERNEKAPEDEQATYARAREAMLEGMSEMEAGVGLLRGFLDDGSPGRLDAGVAQVMAGAERIMQVESVWLELLVARGLAR